MHAIFAFALGFAIGKLDRDLWYINFICSSNLWSAVTVFNVRVNVHACTRVTELVHQIALFIFQWLLLVLDSRGLVTWGNVGLCGACFVC
jgi:hypothetical protein